MSLTEMEQPKILSETKWTEAGDYGRDEFSAGLWEADGKLWLVRTCNSYDERLEVKATGTGYKFPKKAIRAYCKDYDDQDLSGALKLASLAGVTPVEPYNYREFDLRCGR